MIVQSTDPFGILWVSKYVWRDQPIPFAAWLHWLYDHRRTIVKSKQATDPFPDGVLT